MLFSIPFILPLNLSFFEVIVIGVWRERIKYREKEIRDKHRKIDPHKG